MFKLNILTKENIMNFDEYKELAMVSLKKFDSKNDLIANVGLGLAGEAGEVADILKKHLLKSKDIDLPHLKEELGDILWYIAEACECFGFNLSDVANTNIEKLQNRHPKGFDGYGKRE